MVRTLLLLAALVAVMPFGSANVSYAIFGSSADMVDAIDRLAIKAHGNGRRIGRTPA
jgi:hypothetical protein